MAATTAIGAARLRQEAGQRREFACNLVRRNPVRFGFHRNLERLPQIWIFRGFFKMLTIA
ncbi:MAG: hypothetical protein P4M07_23750 [Xanthobacteraceae bacterium]|nr:hypothetical protein [Xanthobacteraceae bacterium]